MQYGNFTLENVNIYSERRLLGEGQEGVVGSVDAESMGEGVSDAVNDEPEEERLCVICASSPVSTTFLPCRCVHLSL